MCGILVYYSKERIDNKELKILERSLDLLYHRVPDAKGKYLDKHKQLFLGHTRLSIIDPDKRANQPMKRDNLVIVFNGEIYNFKEIREKLKSKGYEFHTNSDTETLLLAYKEWGKDCVYMLRGMFAFCIYDENSKELFCARDRIGEKPLICAETHKGVMISSEIKPILESGFIRKRIDEEVLSFLSIGNYKHIPEPFSVWKNIRKLKPGTYIVIKNGRVVEERFYWIPNVKEYKDVTPKEVREKVIEAVELTSVSDVPISILLSGGTDSSIIAFVLKKELGKDVVAFTFGLSENDEEVLRARQVAKILDIPIEIFYFNKKDIVVRLSKIIRHYGEPLCLLQFAYSDILYENIRKFGIKVVLTGNGADEIFYGYTAHTKTFLFSLLLKLFPKDNIYWKMRKWLKSNNRILLRKVQELFKEFKPLIDVFNHEKYYIDFSNFWGLISENSHSITLIGDISGMKNSVEVRSPFLDYKLIEFAFSIHPKKKFGKLLDNKGRYNKYILKKAFENTPVFPFFYLKKMGFGFNIGENRVFGNIKNLVEYCQKIWEEEFL